jgi:hypothetical protein
MVGLAIALGIALMAAMLAVAPATLAGGIARVELGDSGHSGARATIPGQAFSCQLSPFSDRCEATLQGQPLTIALSYPTTERLIFATGVTCQATYGGQPLTCSVAYDYGTGPFPIVQIDFPEGGEAIDRRGIRWQYPAAQLRERGWQWLTLGLVVCWSGTIALRLSTVLGRSAAVTVGAMAGLTALAMAVVGLVWSGIHGLSRSPVVAWLAQDDDLAGGLALMGFLTVVGLVALGLGWGTGRLVYGAVARLPARWHRSLVSLSSGASGALAGFFFATWGAAMPWYGGLAIACLSGAIVGAVLWWRPDLGRVGVGLYSGAVALITLAFLGLWLLLGLGLVD